MSKLKGKVAVVTGASKGIGAAIAEDLANHGASVVVNYSSSEKDAAAVVKKIEAAGGKAKAVHANIGQPGEGGKLIAAAVAEFGRIDILVNNAGVYEFVPLAETSEAQYDRMFNLNVKGLLFTTQAAAKAFGESGGVVVNISSVSAQSARPTTAVYGADQSRGGCLHAYSRGRARSAQNPCEFGATPGSCRNRRHRRHGGVRLREVDVRPADAAGSFGPARRYRVHRVVPRLR